MLPKIKFVYSSIYDRLRKDSPMMKKFLKKQNKSYPSIKKIIKYMGDVEKLWKKDENLILREISKLTRLKWKEKEIKCYVIGFGRGFSDPLTLSLYKNKKDFIDALTHELIHQIQSQNEKKFRKWGKKFLSIKYKKESRSTKSHIFLHSVLKALYLKLFGKKRLKKIINFDKNFKDYKRAWEIVEEEGHENIIKKFRELTK